NRIDEIVVFRPLTQGQIKQVVKLQVDGIQKMLQQNGISLQLEDSAIELLAEVGYDPDFGARPVKRAIQRLLLNDLSKTLLGSHIDRNRPIRVRAEGDHLAFSN
ncbi:MAG: type VI secretion system ATPase TssH, partial [Bacteroidaceae bacterium]|nr:type VI secretion system ATPase TssH [Bacteroidaceae bacterium]